MGSDNDKGKKYEENDSPPIVPPVLPPGSPDPAKLNQATASADKLLEAAPRNFLDRLMRGLRNAFGSNVKGLPEGDPQYNYIDLLEVRALMRFATERGIDADEPAIPPLVDCLLGLDDPNLNGENRKTLDINISNHYKRLCERTYKELKVNGRTIIDSAMRSDPAIRQAGFYFLAFLIAAITPDIGSIMFSNADPSFVYLEMLRMLSPFFWGGVGGSVFLLKTLSEIAGSSRFDTRRYEGVGTRVFLGAIIGFTVVQLFNLSDVLVLTLEEEGTEFQFGENGLAFIAGLGFKVVYGTYETLIMGLYERVTARGKGGSS